MNSYFIIHYMKSFPSALVQGGSSLNPVNANASAKDQILSGLMGGLNQGMASMTGNMTASGLDIDGLNLIVAPDNRKLLDAFDFTEKQKDNPKNQAGKALFKGGYNEDHTQARDVITSENVFKFGAEVFQSMNNYRGYLKDVTMIDNSEDADDLSEIMESNAESKKKKRKDPKRKAKLYTNTIKFKQIAPSLFNPMFGLVNGSITDNVPLLDNFQDGADLMSMNAEVAAYLSDCSIQTLVEESLSKLNLDDSQKLKEGSTMNSATRSSMNSAMDEMNRENNDPKENALQDQFDKENAADAAAEDELHKAELATLKEMRENRSPNISLRKPKRNRQSVLGNAKYKFSDFMYCKHLGQVSNNHLITLRRYALPVPDDITQDKRRKEDMHPDIARLVTWFGTEDNKLENIMNYTVEATWKELNAEHQEQQSQEEDSSRGMVGEICNLASSRYQKQQLAGIALSPFIKNFMGKWGGEPAYAGNPVMNGSHYDKNRIYDPVNSVRSTHKYEGNLKFSHEFTLKFSYTLRAYDNINPKSAFLDLLGNILVMTYKDGSFWGGSRAILGAATNRGAWNKAESMLDGVQNRLMDVFSKFFTGGFDLGALLGGLGSMIKDGMNWINDNVIQPIKKDGVDSAPMKFLGSLGMGVVTGILGGARNKLGRPAVYAFNSLLTKDAVGPWHVTIGNPKNPIAQFGNMIVTKSKITHSGPLGIDDFPTELSVEITLKHAKPRDSSDIQRMYTRGMRKIYYAFSTITNAANQQEINKTTLEAIKQNKSLLGMTDDVVGDGYTPVNDNTAGQFIITDRDYFDRSQLDLKRRRSLRAEFM